MNIIEKLKKSELRGRSGSGFPAGLKWETIKNIKAPKKYVICNASEGEPGVLKDGFILKNYPEEVIEGIKIALKTLEAQKAYIYLRQDYYQKFRNKLKKIIGKSPIELFKKKGGYLCGEETTLLESIEGKREEPRQKPPYPTEKGLFGCPTLINNVETFYYVAKIARGEYKKTRFYSLSGAIKNPGVYELPENWSIAKVLKETNNLPRGRFFVMAGGSRSGEILIRRELNQPVKGVGAIVVYNLKKTNPLSLIRDWADFFYKENCGKCVPCREGVYRLREILKKKKPDWLLLKAIFLVLKETSFCPFGKMVTNPFESLLSKIWLKK